jgi:1,2-dihydroxy-3-keto-5-methylthiopentene dioxygenase
MAKLLMENGEVLTDLAHIGAELAPLGVKLSNWPVSEEPQITELLAKDSLTDEEKGRVLEAHDHYFNEMKAREGYQTRDLIVIHGGIPNIDELLAKFDKCHTHSEDEVRYIVAGDGVFGFVRPDGSQVELTVEPEEYINVPTGTEHWFHLTASKRIKAIRYFTSTAGWTPEYTGTGVRIGVK